MLDRMNKYSAQGECDAVGIIADTVEELIGLLREFDEKASNYGQKQLEAAWPSAQWPDATVVEALNKLCLRLTPPDDYDPADRNLEDRR